MAQLGRLYKYMLRSNGNAVSGVSLTVYREGATVNGAQSGISPLNVTVRHVGKIQTGDFVFTGTTPSTTFSATVTSTTLITLSGFSGTLSLADGDRLTPTGSKPTLYADDQGGTSTTNPLTSSSTGLCQCWVEFGGYDLLQSGGGLSTLMHTSQVVGSEAPGQIRFADDFAALSVSGGIQEAIDDLPSAGGKVLCSAGRTYSLNGGNAATASIWLHPGVELHIPAGTTIQRATGSLASAIGVICASPKGSNGTEFGSSTTGSNISITGSGTIDGNYSAFAGSVGHGIRIKYVDGLLIDGPTIINTKQDGVYIDGCRNFRISNLFLNNIGQATTVTQRNGMSIYSTGNTTGWGQHGAINNINIVTVGAAGATAAGEGISLLDVADVTVSNVTVDGCDYTLELNAHSTDAEWNRNLTFSNIVSKNARFTFIALLDNVAATWRDVAFSNCTFEGHSTLHSGSAVRVNVNTTGTFDGLSFSNIIARNINTADTASIAFFHYQSTTGAGSTGLNISNCKFYGKAGSTVITCAGVSLNGGLADAIISNTLVKDVPGIGFNVGGVTAVTSTARNVVFNGCIADTCTGDGFKVSAGTTGTTQYDVNFYSCIAKDCGISGNNSRGFFLTTTVGAGAIVQDIHLADCRAYKTSGTFMLYGLNCTAFAASTLGPVYVDDCDFTGVQTAELVTSGTITNLRCTGKFVGAIQAILAVGNTITLPSLIKDCVIRLTADGNYTLTSAPTLANGGFEGQEITIINEDTAETITVQDQGTLASSNLRLSGVSVALAPRDNMRLIWNGTIGDWVQTGFLNVV